MARVKQIPFGAGAPQPTQQQVQRLQLAQRLMEQGGSTAPVYSPLEGIARLGHGALGGILSRREEEKQRKREEAYSQDLSTILAGAGAKPWVNPDTGQTQGQAGGLAGMLASADHLQTPEAKASLQQMALAQALNPQAGPRPVTVAPGASLVNPETGQPIYTAPERSNLDAMVVPGPDGKPMINPLWVQAKKMTQRPPDSVDIRVDTSDKAFAKEFGKVNAQKFMEDRSAAEDAAQALTSNQDARNLLNQGVITGAGADFKLAFGKLLQASGFQQSTDAVRNTEAFIAGRAQAVARMAKQFGSGAGITDADREFATKAAGGSIEMSEPAIRRILDIEDKMARSRIASFNEKAKTIDSEMSPYPLVVEEPAFGEGAPAPAGNTPAPLTIPIEYGGGGEKGPIKVTDEASYNAVPSGATFIDPQGNIRTKR